MSRSNEIITIETAPDSMSADDWNEHRCQNILPILMQAIIFDGVNFIAPPSDFIAHVWRSVFYVSEDEKPGRYYCRYEDACERRIIKR